MITTVQWVMIYTAGLLGGATGLTIQHVVRQAKRRRRRRRPLTMPGVTLPSQDTRH